MKKNKGSGKSIIAAARKMAEITWALLIEKQDFDSKKMMGKYKTYESFRTGSGCHK